MQKISSKNYNVVVTSNFKMEVKILFKKYPSVKTDLLTLVEKLEKNPKDGISLGKDCFKIRMAIRSKGRGKSGGSRVITCVKVVSETVYLLTIFDKSVKEGVSDKELNELLKIAGL